jgi:hypothetical protein
MGGFRIEQYSSSRTPTVEKSPSTPSTDPRLTVDVLNFYSFAYIMEHFPEIIPDIPEESITDRAESTILSKALLIVQVGWFFLNGVSRLIQHLPLSFLEVSTAAHAFCALLVFLVLWSKPLNIAEGTVITGQKAREVHALLKCSRNEYHKALSLAESIPARDSPIPTYSNEKVTLAANALEHRPPAPERTPSERLRRHGFSSSPGSSAVRSTSHDHYARITLAISPILYGLIHFLAWNGHFPTPLEHLSWRISSVVVMCSGLIIVTSWMVDDYVTPKGASVMSTIINVIDSTLKTLVVLSILVYVLASSFLVVESFRQLFFLEPEVYQIASWSHYWPHLS